MDEKRLLVIAEDCSKKSLVPDNEKAFLQLVASKCVEAGYLRNARGYASAELGDLFTEHQREFLINFYNSQNKNSGLNIDEPKNNERKPKDLRNKSKRELIDSPLRGLSLFTFGIIFVTVMLVLSLFFSEPSPFQYFVFRIVLALAASGITASIPGFLEVRVSNGVRAGGALAVFVIVFFFSPASLITR